MPTLASPTYYVYVLCRPDGSPFYVGKGQRARVYDHERYARARCRCHKCNVIRKIWRSGGEVQRYIVFTTDDEVEALAYEAELIALYGRQTLANYADGGPGARGVTRSAATRKRLAQAAKRHWATPEIRERMVAGLRRRATDPDYLAAQSARAQRMWEDPAYRAKMSVAFRDPAVNAARHAGLQTDSYRETRRAIIKNLWADPNYRATIEAARATPEFHALRSARSKAMWQDPEFVAKQKALRTTPEYRARQSAARKARWADPEYRATQLAALRRRKRTKDDL